VSFGEFKSVEEGFNPDHDGANEMKEGLKDDKAKGRSFRKKIREKDGPKSEADNNFHSSSDFSKNIDKLPSLTRMMRKFDKIHKRKIDCTEKEAPKS